MSLLSAIFGSPSNTAHVQTLERLKGDTDNWTKYPHEYLNVFHHRRLPITLRDYEEHEGWMLRFEQTYVSIRWAYDSDVHIALLAKDAERMAAAGRAGAAIIESTLTASASQP